MDQGGYEDEQEKDDEQKIQAKNHRTQGSTKQLNETTSLTPSLVIFRRG
jgi:hypothetical protein